MNTINTTPDSFPQSIRLLLIILLLFFPAMLLTQEPLIRFERITTNEGLSQNMVHHIYQDRLGYLWFCTQDGLSQYDGYSMTIYRSETGDSLSLVHPEVSDIYEDSSGVITFFTVGGSCELTPENREKGIFVNRKKIKEVTAYLHDSAGRFWLATSGNLKLFKNEREIPLLKPEIPKFKMFVSEVITTICESPDGTLWFGTKQNGIFRVRMKDDEIEALKHYLHQLSDTGSLPDYEIEVIYEDRAGILWIGSKRGLSRYDPSTDGFIHYKHDPQDRRSIGSGGIRAILEGRDGYLWFGSSRSGLNRYSLSLETRQKRTAAGESLTNRGHFDHFRHDPSDMRSLSDDNVLALFQDRSGIIWVGTQSGGVNKFDPAQLQFHHFNSDPENPYALPENGVWAFYEDTKNNIWVGTTQGIALLRRDENGTLHFSPLPGDAKVSDRLKKYQVRAFHQPEEEVLWLGTLHHGLVRYDLASGDITELHNVMTDSSERTAKVIYAIFEDRQGRVWIGVNGYNGLYQVVDSTPEQVILKPININKPHYPSDNNWLLSIQQSGDDYLWLGSWSRGLYRMSPDANSIRNYVHDPQNSTSLSQNYAFSILEDRVNVNPDGAATIMWIGTWGGGLNKLNTATGDFIRYTRKDGLPNDVIYGILQDSSGKLWLSTNLGISCFDPITENIRNFDVDDGLQGKEFNLGAAFKCRNGEMLFGGNNGFNAFFPTSVINRTPPQVVLTAFRKFGRREILDEPLFMQDTLYLSYSDNFIGFEFVALHFKNPGKNRYAYMMQGFDDRWIHVGNRREAGYTNLDPGAYIFRVKAANADGLWNENGASVTIIISPPFWQTWYFRGAVLAFTLLIIYLVYRYRVRQVLQLERTRAQERAELRKAILRDFHDEAGQLSWKMLLDLDMLKQSLSNDHAAKPQDLNVIIDYAGKLDKSIRDLMWDLDPEKDSLLDLALELSDYSEQLLHHTDIAFEIDEIPPDADKIRLEMSRRQHLLRIFKEALNNILKHAAGCRYVRLNINHTDDNITLSLSDDGRGFDPGKNTSGLGLKNMRERAGKIGAVLNIHSEQGSGTTIRLTLNLYDSRVASDSKWAQSVRRHIVRLLRLKYPDTTGIRKMSE